MCRWSVLGLKTTLLQLSEAKKKLVAHLNATCRSKLIYFFNTWKIKGRIWQLFEGNKLDERNSIKKSTWRSNIWSERGLGPSASTFKSFWRECRRRSWSKKSAGKREHLRGAYWMLLWREILETSREVGSITFTLKLALKERVQWIRQWSVPFSYKATTTGKLLRYHCYVFWSTPICSSCTDDKSLLFSLLFWLDVTDFNTAAKRSGDRYLRLVNAWAIFNKFIANGKWDCILRLVTLSSTVCN